MIQFVKPGEHAYPVNEPGFNINTTYQVKLVRITKGNKGVSVVIELDPSADLSDLYEADGDTTFALVKLNR